MLFGVRLITDVFSWNETVPDKTALNLPSHHEETVCRHIDGERYVTSKTRTTQLQREVDGRPSQNVVLPAPTLPVWARGRAESYDDPLAWWLGISELWHNQLLSCPVHTL